MMFDPFKPQPYNVAIGDHEIADDQPRIVTEPPPIPYEIPQTVLLEPDVDIYPRRRYGMMPGMIRAYESDIDDDER